MDKLTRENVNKVIDAINADADLQQKIKNYLDGVNKSIGGNLTAKEASIIKARLVMDIALSIF